MRVLVLLKRPLENQTVRFLSAGSMTAFLYFGLIYVLLTLGMPSWLSALVAYLAAFSVGYVAHKFFTFQSVASHSTSLPRYALLQISCAAIATVSAGAAERFGLTQPLIISLISTVVLGTVSYLASSKWVFSK